MMTGTGLPGGVKVVVSTHNRGKLVEIRRLLDEAVGEGAARIRLVTAGELGLPDPVETGVTFEQNALLKARFASSRTGLPALADDSGLVVDVMGAAPGILSARWSGRHGDDQANMDLLLAQLEDIPDGARGAEFVCAAALVLPGNRAAAGAGAADARPGQSEPAGGPAGAGGKYEVVRLGRMRGRIARELAGENGFGYDPIFIPDDQPSNLAGRLPPLTSAQLTPDEKNAMSHRGKALRAIVPCLLAALGQEEA